MEGEQSDRNSLKQSPKMVEREELITEMKSRYIKHRGITMWDFNEPEKMTNFEVRDSDVWVCSFPRSGTTLVQEMTFLINTLDFESTQTKQLDERFPFADINNPEYPYYKGLDGISTLDSPRMIKSHYHYFLLPDDIKNGKGKIIYVTRNPKSSILSNYKLSIFYRIPVAHSLREYIEMVLNDEVYACPWWSHVREYWEHREDHNVLFLKYEDIIKDKRSVIRKIAEFLGRSLSENDITKIFEHTQLEKMKSNTMVDSSYHEKFRGLDRSEGEFINTGKIDGWKNEVPLDLQERIDAMVKDKLGDTEIAF